MVFLFTHGQMNKYSHRLIKTATVLCTGKIVSKEKKKF